MCPNDRDDPDYGAAAGQAALALVTQLIVALGESDRITMEEARAIGDAAQLRLEQMPAAAHNADIRLAIKMVDAWTQGLHGLRPSKGI